MKKFSVFLLGILLSLNFQMNHFHTKSNDGNRNLTKLEKIFKKNIPNTITKSRINQPVEENGLVSTGGWHLDEINIKDAQDMYFTGKGVNVAVIDSGITNNIELNIYKKVNCYVASGNNTNCNENFSFEDSFVNSETGIPGHGTQVAGVIAGQDGIGIAPGVNLYSVRITDNDGNTTPESLIAALDWCMKNNIDIINFSWRIQTEDNTALIEKANEVYNSGIIIVASAGNSGNDSPEVPDNMNKGIQESENVIKVGAVGKWIDSGNLERLTFSSTGTKLDLTSPGIYIKTTSPIDNGIESEQGASFSTPIVTGILALLKEQYPENTNEELKQKLYNMVTPLYGWNGDINQYTDDKNWEYGRGVIQSSLFEKPVNDVETITLEGVQFAYDSPSVQSSGTILEKGQYQTKEAWNRNQKTQEYNWYKIETTGGDKWVKTQNNPIDFTQTFKLTSTVKGYLFPSTTTTSYNFTNTTVTTKRAFDWNKDESRFNWYLVDTNQGELWINPAFSETNSSMENGLLEKINGKFVYTSDNNYTNFIDNNEIPMLATEFKANESFEFNLFETYEPQSMALSLGDNSERFTFSIAFYEKNQSDPIFTEFLSSDDFVNNKLYLQLPSLKGKNISKIVFKNDSTDFKLDEVEFFGKQTSQNVNPVDYVADLYLRNTPVGYYYPSTDADNTPLLTQYITTKKAWGWNEENNRFDWYLIDTPLGERWIKPDFWDVYDLRNKGLIDTEQGKMLEENNNFYINNIIDNNADSNGRMGNGIYSYRFLVDHEIQGMFLKMQPPTEPIKLTVSFYNSDSNDPVYTKTITNSDFPFTSNYFDLPNLKGKNINKVTLKSEGNVTINEFELFGKKSSTEKQVNFEKKITLNGNITYYDEPSFNSLNTSRNETNKNVKSQKATGWNFAFSGFDWYLVPFSDTENKWIHVTNVQEDYYIYKKGLIDTEYGRMFEPADSSLNGNYNPNYPYKTYRFDDPVTIKQFYVKTNSYITDGTDLKLEFFDKNNTKISEKIISKDDYFNEFVELPEPITGVTYIKASYIGWVSIDQIDFFGSLEPTTREPISFKTIITPATTNGTIQVYDDHNLDSNSTTVTIPSGKTFTSSKAWGLNANFQNYYDWYLVTDESLGIINKWIRINSQREVSNNIFSEGLLDKVDFTGDKGSSIFDNLDYTNLYLSENNITFNSPVNIDQVYVKSYSINNKLTFIFTDSSGNETTYNMTNDDFHYRHFTIPRVENVVSVKIKTANTNNSYINEVDFYDSQR